MAKLDMVTTSGIAKMSDLCHTGTNECFLPLGSMIFVMVSSQVQANYWSNRSLRAPVLGCVRQHRIFPLSFSTSDNPLTPFRRISPLMTVALHERQTPPRHECGTSSPASRAALRMDFPSPCIVKVCTPESCSISMTHCGRF